MMNINIKIVYARDVLNVCVWVNMAPILRRQKCKWVT